MFCRWTISENLRTPKSCIQATGRLSLGDLKAINLIAQFWRTQIRLINAELVGPKFGSNIVGGNERWHSKQEVIQWEGQNGEA